MDFVVAAIEQNLNMDYWLEVMLQSSFYETEDYMKHCNSSVRNSNKTPNLKYLNHHEHPLAQDHHRLTNNDLQLKSMANNYLLYY